VLDPAFGVLYAPSLLDVMRPRSVKLDEKRLARLKNGDDPSVVLQDYLDDYPSCSGHAER
jgi:hypothetical protein